METEDETIWRGLARRFVLRRRQDPNVTLAAFGRAINVPSYEKLRRYVIQAREEESAGTLPLEPVRQVPDTKIESPFKLGADPWNKALLKLKGPDETPFFVASISYSEDQYKALFGVHAPPFPSEAAQVFVGTLGDHILNSGEWLLIAERALAKILDRVDHEVNPEGPLGPFTFRRGGPSGAFFHSGKWVGASVFITRSELAERGIRSDSLLNSQMVYFAKGVGDELVRSSWGADIPGICGHLAQQFSVGKLFKLDEPGEGAFVNYGGRKRNRSMWVPSRAAYWKMRLKKPH